MKAITQCGFWRAKGVARSRTALLPCRRSSHLSRGHKRDSRLI